MGATRFNTRSTPNGVFEEQFYLKSANCKRIGRPIGRRSIGLAIFLFSLIIGLWLPLNSAIARQQASIVVDMTTNAALHSANADTQIYPASLTKMMTLYLLFDALARGEVRLDSQMSVSALAASREPSRLGLAEGQTIAVGQAIPALVVKSANDVATVVAEALGGTETEFARLMTARARLLGMGRTTFRNASGLHDPAQHSTARDMARLGRALFEDFPQFYDYFDTISFTYGGRTYNSHNDLVTDYQGADGIKTGYVRASGFNVVTSARKGHRRLIAVVIGGETARARDRRMRSLLDAAFVTADNRARSSTLVAAAPAPQRLGRTNQSNQVAVAAMIRPDRRPNANRTTPAVSPADASAITQVASMVAPRPNAISTAPAIATAAMAAPTRASRGLSNFLIGTAHAAQAPAAGGLTPAAGPVDAATNWGIQVGAFGSPDTARKYANDVAVTLPGSERAIARVQTIAVNGEELHRARIFGFSESEAQTNCQQLQAAGQSCLMVRPDGINISRTASN